MQYGGKNILENIYRTLFVFLTCIFVKCICLACIVVILCVFVVPYAYLWYLMCICCTFCVFVVSYVYLLYLICICCTLNVFIVSYMYLFYLVCIFCTLYVFVVPYVYLLYYVCIAVLTLDAGLLARSQYLEGPATSTLDTGFSWFPCVYKRMLRRFPSFQVATTCLSCSPPDLNFLVTFFFIFVYM